MMPDTPDDLLRRLRSRMLQRALDHDALAARWRHLADLIVHGPDRNDTASISATEAGDQRAPRRP